MVYQTTSTTFYLCSASSSSKNRIRIRIPEAAAEVQVETEAVVEAVVEAQPEPEDRIEQSSTDHTRITTTQQSGKTSCCDAIRFLP